MKIACNALVGLVLLQGAVYAQVPIATPEIQVVDGKVSMAVQSMPLGRLLSLLDRAAGLNSQVKPELANRNVSVRFTGLSLREAVHKIFEGQPLNYVLIEGKGIRVTELAQVGTTTTTSSSASFDSGPVFNPSPLPGISPIQPVNAAPAAAQPINPATQPAAINTPFGLTTPPPVSVPATTPTGGFTPGQIPPPIGANNPLVNPVGAQPPVSGGAPGSPIPAPQPTGPGTLGATPGAIR